MSLATELLRRVTEAKKKADDEMGVPSYDNLRTPNNHVGNSSNATQERKVSGLGDRTERNPTAEVGTPHEEKGRDKIQVKATVKENAVGDLGLAVRNGLLTFHHPNNPDEVYHIEWDRDAMAFLQNVMRKVKDTSQLYDLLMDYYEQGPGHDPRNMTPYRPDDMQLTASKGQFPMAEQGGGVEQNPIGQALQIGPLENGMRFIQAPDGSAAAMVPWNPAIAKSVSAFIMSPEAKANTTGAANLMFKKLAAVRGAQAAQPRAIKGSRDRSATVGQGVDPDAGSNLSLVPKEPDIGAAALGGDPFGGSAGFNPRQRANASIGEGVHKRADGEMANPKVSGSNPAHTNRVPGRFDDEPTNKGNPGTGREEKGQSKEQFSNNPKHEKTRGDNAHKNMKKMHENIEGLEKLLGRKLQLQGTEFSG